MNLKLVKPNLNLENEYYEFAKEWDEHKEGIIPYSARLLDMDYKSYLDYNSKFENESTCPKELVCATTYFLVNKNDKILGAINIRHRLNDYLLNFGGHIGYGIRPSERKKGYASIMLKLGLEIAKQLGIDKALITCDKSNVGSSNTIIKNGGILENEMINDGKVVQRYWIDI